MSNNVTFEFLKSGGSIVVNKSLASSIGMNETIIFCELVSRYEYFEGKGDLTEEGFFYNTVDDLERGTTLGAEAQRNAIKKLEKLGFIECKVMGVPPKRHFKILADDSLILQYVAEGRIKTKALEEKQKQTMKIKVKQNKINKEKKEKLKASEINNSTESKESITENPRNQLEGKQGINSTENEELIQRNPRKNNTNIIIPSNNTKKESLSSIEQSSNILEELKEIVKPELPEPLFNLWVKPLEALEPHGDNLVIAVPNNFTKNMIENRYLEILKKALSLKHNYIEDIEVKVKE